EVDGLVKRYGDLVAVDGATFAADAGEIFALLGPNGAGKTTTVEIVEGLRDRDGGNVRVLDADPETESRRLAPRIGVMPQSGDLRDRGVTVVLTTHMLDEAERVADRVAIMHRGRIVALGSPAELAGTHRALTFTVERAIDAHALSSALGVAVEKRADGYRITGA